jgi:hypothetical protein
MNHILKMNKRYSKRIRSLLRGRNLPNGRVMFLHVEKTSIQELIWCAGHNSRTDRFVRRLLTLGMLRITESY